MRCVTNEEKIQFFFHGVSLHQKKRNSHFVLFLSRRVVFRVFRFNNEVLLCGVDFLLFKNFIYYFINLQGLLGWLMRDVSEASYKNFVRFECHENVLNRERHFITTKSQ